MERQTQPGYEYHPCDFMDDGVYADMNLLREYEDADLTPEQIRELKERDTAKAPVDIDDEFDIYVCPSCNMAIGVMGDREEHHFCLNCGQRLKWEDCRSVRQIPRLPSGSGGSRTKLMPKKSTEARKDKRYDSKRSIRR